MRRCMLDDLLAGAGRISIVATSLRADLARRLVLEAHAAHHYMRRMGRPHPRWGNGSLMARALSDMTVPRAALCLASIAVMADAVDRFRRENAALSHGLLHRAVLCYGHGERGGDHGRNQGKTLNG